MDQMTAKLLKAKLIQSQSPVPVEKTRFIFATDWSRPGTLLTVFKVCAQLSEHLQECKLIISVPHHPDQADQDFLEAILASIPTQPNLEITLQAFEDAALDACAAVFVPTGDDDIDFSQMGDFLATLTNFAHQSPANRQQMAQMVSSTKTGNILAKFSPGKPQPASEPASADQQNSDSAPVVKPRESTYCGDGRILTESAWGHRLYCSSKDRSLTPLVVQNGYIDPGFSHLLCQILSEGMTFVDIGASIGIHTVLAASLVQETGQVIAFEPNPENFELLTINSELSLSGDIITCSPLGVWSEPGEQSFLFDHHRLAESTCAQAAKTLLEAKTPADSAVTSVQVDTAANLLKNLGTIDFINITVEGAEEDVLAGLEPLLSSANISAMSLGYDQRKLGTNATAFHNRLCTMNARGWNFSVTMNDGSLQEIDVKKLSEVDWLPRIILHR